MAGHMMRLLHTKTSRRKCGYTRRWQVETVNSMMKRNLGSSLRGKTAWSRKRDMALKTLTHNLMILRLTGSRQSSQHPFTCITAVSLPQVVHPESLRHET